jgi:hypothetical protein
MSTHSTSPAYRMVAVTPSDTVDLAFPARGLYVGTAGDVTIKCMDDTVVTLPNVVAGMVHAINFKRVNATATTAVSIRAAY